MDFFLTQGHLQSFIQWDNTNVVTEIGNGEMQLVISVFNSLSDKQGENE